MGGIVSIEVAESRAERVRGLLGRDCLEPGVALLIPRCRSVHTFGMRFPIAVVFLSEDLRVLRVAVVRPGRLLRPRMRTRHILECRPEDAPAPGMSIEVAGL